MDWSDFFSIIAQVAIGIVLGLALAVFVSAVIAGVVRSFKNGG